MGNEISKVYQFISNFGSVENWKKEIDEKYGNNDGVVIKTEFRNFMLNEFCFESDGNKQDIINKFWASIDSKTSGKVGSTGINNKNALDCDELKLAEEIIKATDKINAYVASQQVPAGIKNVDNWRNSVKESLLNKALDYLKQNKDAKAECWRVCDAFKETNRQTTADYVAKETIQEKFGDIDGYDADKDKALQRVVDTYVQSLSGCSADSDGSTDIDTIAQRARELVSAYADTADTNSDASIELLGSSYNANGGLNDLQKAVLVRDVKAEIISKLQDQKSELYSKHAETIDAMITEFVKKGITNKKAKEFTSLKSSLVDDFMSTKVAELEESIKKAEAEKDLNDAKAQAKAYVAEILAKGGDYRAAIIEIYGANYVTTIDACSSKSELEALKTKLDAKVLEADKAAQEAERKAKYAESFKNLATTLDDIATDKLSTMVNGQTAIHTEFGVDEKGDIVFEQSNTTEVYNTFKATLISEFKTRNNAAYESLGSTDTEREELLGRLIQSAWITSYNSFKSSQSNATSSFLRTTMNNLENILNRLSTNPEYKDLYTGHTAYANSKLTSGLIHYGTTDTIGNDANWNYDGGYKTSSNGSVTFVNETDSGEYELVMDELLKRIKKTEPYKSLDPNVITSVFREAQAKAITNGVEKVPDCPFGTTAATINSNHYGQSTGYAKSTDSPIATANMDWAGVVSRGGDTNNISPKALIELTLYYFDKLLYAKMAQ